MRATYYEQWLILIMTTVMYAPRVEGNKLTVLSFTTQKGPRRASTIQTVAGDETSSTTSQQEVVEVVTMVCVGRRRRKSPLRTGALNTSSTSPHFLAILREQGGRDRKSQWPQPCPEIIPYFYREGNEMSAQSIMPAATKNKNVSKYIHTFCSPTRQSRKET